MWRSGEGVEGAKRKEEGGEGRVRVERGRREMVGERERERVWYVRYSIIRGKGDRNRKYYQYIHLISHFSTTRS